MTDPTPITSGSAQDWPGTGHVLADRYRLVERIRVGPIGARWHAWDDQLHRHVTLKVLLPHLAADGVVADWFRRESLATARIRHPNVVSLYDAHDDGGYVFLVLEHVDGPSLERFRGTALPGDVVAAIGAQAADGLAAAHELQLLHRDVRPDNLLLAPTGWVKVANFGLSKDLAAESTLQPVLRDLFAYASPEQLAGEPCTTATDVYGLGLSLWEALTGRAPFDDLPVAAAATARLQGVVPLAGQGRDDLPSGLAETIAIATRRDPADRYATARDFGDALRAICGPRPQGLAARLVDPDPGAGGRATA